jgi:hypothetical protein
MMAGKQKEVDEWLMGSGESGETADSVKNQNGVQNMPLFKIMVSQKDEKQQLKQEDDDRDGWMFSTFEQKH